MVKLHEQYGDRGLEIFAFPCNQFAEQEPGSNCEIKEWAQSTYNVKFPMFCKIEVNGENTHPVYQFLRDNSDLKGGDIPWNFAKFLLNEMGQVVSYNGPNDPPFSFKEDIEKLL